LSCYIFPTIVSSSVGPAIKLVENFLKTDLLENDTSLKPLLFCRNILITTEALLGAELIFWWK